MTSWYGKITEDPDDLTPLVDAMAYYEAEVERANKELNVSGRIEEIQKRIPGWAAFRFNQLQELEAILKYLNLKMDKKRGEKHRFYMEKYARAMSSRDAEKYAEGDDDVLEIAMLINQVALVRNKFLGVSKGIEYLHYQIGGIVKLRVAGIEDATL